jgi:tetratricopeptide (TPR) repeat protein
MFALADKHVRMWQAEKAAEFSTRILQRGDEAKKVEMPFGRDRVMINVYEAARYSVGSRRLWDQFDPEPLEVFRKEFPESLLSINVYGELASAYMRLPMSESSDAFYEDLITQFPDNGNLLVRYVEYRSRRGTEIEKGAKIARKLIELDQDSGWFRRVAAQFFIKADREQDAFSMYGDAYIRKHLDDPSTLNSYAWFWALEEKNLNSALNAQLNAIEVDPEDANLYDTLSMVYWKMKDFENALKSEEQAFRMNPLDSYQEQIEKIKADMAKQ